MQKIKNFEETIRKIFVRSTKRKNTGLKTLAFIPRFNPAPVAPYQQLL